MPKYQRKLPPLDPCPVEAVLEIIGGRWAARMLYQMLDHGVRLVDLQRAIPQASQQVLSEQLRHLRKMGTVERVTDSSSAHPRRVFYQLTPEGESLKPVLWTMAKWGMSRIGDTWPACGTPRETKLASRADSEPLVATASVPLECESESHPHRISQPGSL